MSADVFLDTNVLVYLIDDADRKRQRRARELVRDMIAADRACISSQVVQEFVNVALQKMRPALEPALVRSHLDDLLLPMCRVWTTPALVMRALEVKALTGFAFYDALIVAAAQEAGCATLLTEDLQAGRQIGKLTIANPFG